MLKKKMMRKMSLLHLHGVTDKDFSISLSELKLRKEVARKIEFQVMLAGFLHISTDVLDWILFRTPFNVL